MPLIRTVQETRILVVVNGAAWAIVPQGMVIKIINPLAEATTQVTPATVAKTISPARADLYTVATWAIDKKATIAATAPITEATSTVPETKATRTETT